MRHWPPVLRDVLLLHEPGPRAAGPPEELEGDEGLQERRLPAAEGSRREGRSVAFARAWGRAHTAHQGTGRLHRRWSRGPHEGRHLSVLSAFPQWRIGGSCDKRLSAL